MTWWEKISTFHASAQFSTSQEGLVASGLEASIVRMKALNAQADQEAFIDENRAFHGVIARASGNKVLEVFWQTISIIAHGEHHGIRYSVGNQAHVVKAHQRILEACRSRDGDAAAAAMEAHVTELEHLVRARHQHLLKHPTSVVERPGRAIRTTQEESQ